jgi:hypothetical protein
VAVTGYERKYAIRLLLGPIRPPAPIRRPRDPTQDCSAAHINPAIGQDAGNAFGRGTQLQVVLNSEQNDVMREAMTCHKPGGLGCGMPMLIVSIGDSTGSGEGNPDTPGLRQCRRTVLIGFLRGTFGYPASVLLES